MTEEERKSEDSTETRASQMLHHQPSSDDIPPIPPLSALIENINRSFDKELNLNLVTNTVRPTDDYGFYLDTKDCTPHVELSVKQKKNLTSKENEWISLLSNWDQSIRKKKNKKMCRQGVPDSLRAQVWQNLTGSSKKKIVGKFNELRSRSDKPPIFDIIERDIHRCFPSKIFLITAHVMFSDANGEGQKNLRDVLRVYALYNPALGYCQGMGMLVGLLLMRMSPEDAFWMLVVILENYIPDYHSENLYQLRVDAAAFELCLKKFQRPLARHMHELKPLNYMTQWFLTLYTMTLPWSTVLRLWDMFLHDGAKALFRAGIGILAPKKSYIIKYCPTSSDILEYLFALPKQVTDADEFIEECLKIKLGHKDLDKMRNQVKMAHSSLDSGVNKR
ncbi:hypothetical protein HDV01_004876 [Terramyces sp. JEL0728]|nr:hypothetical protein HDV01_004876 [Terramyces sp. JEL0728]